MIWISLDKSINAFGEFIKDMQYVGVPEMVKTTYLVFLAVIAIVCILAAVGWFIL